MSSVAASASRRIMSSPTATERSGFTVTNTGLSGRGCGSSALAGSSTPRSTVASGAATMKMISSTSITSMNGVTLISCASTRSSSARRRPPSAPLEPSRVPMDLLRGARQPEQAAIALAADQEHHDRRDRRDQAERGGEQRLGDTGRDHRKVGGVGLRDADEGIHDAPDRAEQ